MSAFIKSVSRTVSSEKVNEILQNFELSSDVQHPPELQETNSR